MARLVKRALAATIVAGAVFTGVMGFAHTRSGRPLLRLLGRVYAPARCPLGFDQRATPEQREAARRAFAAAHRSPVSAPARPALGFALDGTGKDDVLAWGRAHQVACREGAGGPDLQCEGVPAALLPGPAAPGETATLWFDFGAAGKLISLTAIRRAPEAAPIAGAFDGATRELQRQTGAAPVVHGALGDGALSQVSAELALRNYYALARATNMGDGYLLTEVYRSLPE